ncbi:B12-binding domain-containing radical SAM protein [Flavobacterium sp.]|uniref:B12-binding domain-containing radical SAM protein n=1 Tax=Flavobacterium sp. TaxID=239 RepID=UPI0025C5D3BB|nr:B12-binding domain-containing radical SAM protein [Flavobacterium sp.]
MKPILLITPPFTQLNTPYPATAYLKGFFNTKNIESTQMDLGIDVILALFSREGLLSIFNQIDSSESLSENACRIFSLKGEYITTIDAVITFLQGKNPSLARQIVTSGFLPEASRFANFHEDEEAVNWAFGTMGMQDKAKHLATLYLEDLSDFIVECIDENFGFSRYAERLGRSANSFNELYTYLQKTPTFIDRITLQILEDKIQLVEPQLVCFSVPFPGNLYSAFRCAQYIKNRFPTIKIAMGGGFPNTELRDLKDIRVFEFFDFITLDDGELPLELLYYYTQSNNPNLPLKRTFLIKENQLIYQNDAIQVDYKQSKVGTPDYSDLLLDQYISVIEVANPMHSLWSDGRWNKLTMAHGCYWGKCTFCDISLDYIKVYEPIHAKILVDRMEALIQQTGETGFHFVDEAAPPVLMREVALEILRRKLIVTWWTNIRFEKSFTADLCMLLKLSGCIAVSGGLEVASDRLLALIKKGVTVEQVANVTKNFTESGIMVHAYLMYGYPTQTVQETVDALEMVRQLFELGIVQSGFWHQFAMTAHSPVGMNPDEFGVVPNYKEISFANNDVQFKDKTGIDHDKFSFGLKKSLFNYMHGIGFDFELQEWFDFKIPKTKIPFNFIETVIQQDSKFSTKPASKIVWIGSSPSVKSYVKTKKGNSWEMLELVFYSKTLTVSCHFEKEKGEWLLEKLEELTLTNPKLTTFSELKTDFERFFEDFELFWYSKYMIQLRAIGLLSL